MAKPKPSFVKCKIDAALFVNQNYYGISAIKRDDKGDFVQAFTVHQQGIT
jgi:hypothetical protein